MDEDQLFGSLEVGRGIPDGKNDGRSKPPCYERQNVDTSFELLETVDQDAAWKAQRRISGLSLWGCVP